ncbi:hypothetical protein AOC05_02905 [Arthrobacter alpinus]|uniref:SipW-cognate class signal peptide n=1 Tax=Arthrobacter alpinus TaxID=656366 RepID=A0A0M4QV43_9MICC|nr:MULTISPECIES: hypothetical protein [Arthrobacter]ALE91536.1 hypothetical protein AOC05_02905 [Arthrobacter alpinus]
MKSTRALKATGLVLIAVVLGLLTVQGSYALWNKSTTANAGTVQAADFRISLTDAISGEVTENMTRDDGTPVLLSLKTMATGVLIPGQKTYAGVQLGNRTNAGGDFTVRATTATPVIVSPGSELASQLSIKVVNATSLSQCTQPAIYTAAPVAGAATQDIAKAATGVFCFEVSLAATMPANLSGKTAKVDVPIVVNQL